MASWTPRPVSAQDADAAVADTVQAPPTPIPIGDIPARSEQAAVDIRSAAQDTVPARGVSAIEAALPAEIASLAQRLRELASAPLEARTIRSLQDRHFRWIRSHSRLDDWRNTLELRRLDLQVSSEELDELAATWEATVESLQEAPDPPEEVSGVATSIVQQIEAVQNRLQELGLEVVVLQARVTAQQEQIVDALAYITEGRNEARRALFRRDSPALWQPGSINPGGLVDELQQSWGPSFRSIRLYTEQSRGRIYAQLFVFLLILSITVAAARLAAAREEPDDTDDHGAYVLRRPVSAAVALTLGASLYLHPLAPNAWMDLLILLSIPAVAWLVPARWRETHRVTLYWFIALQTLNILGHLASEDGSVMRLLTVPLLAWVVWTLRREGPALDSSKSFAGGASLLGLRFATLIMTVASVSYVFGWQRLSLFLADGTQNSIYGLIWVFTASVILINLLRTLPDTRASSWFPSLGRHSESIVQRGRRLVSAGAVVLGAWVVLVVFDLGQPVLDGIESLLRASAEVGPFSLSLGGALAFGLILWLAFLASRTIRFLLSEEILPRLKIESGPSAAISTLLGWVVIALGIILAGGAAGLQGSQLAVVAGALSVGIGFGLQGVVNNFVSGLILIFERPLSIGDRVEVGTLLGEVRRIGIRASVVRTFEGAEVIVPNSTLVSDQVVNWTLSDQLRRSEVHVGVAYGTDPETVMELLISAAEETPDVLRYPKPQALFYGFGDSSLDFAIRFWTAHFDDWVRVKSEVTVAVNGTLAKAGIEIPFPQRDVHLRGESEESDPEPEVPPLAQDPEDLQL